ncbi:MAG TPA: phosphodiester glycosidase family protein [Myxococcota bacterium]|nr:phosphodiester glycosidase family protein [Myxococcota bacterium]
MTAARSCGAGAALLLVAAGGGCSSAPMPIGPPATPVMVGVGRLLREEGVLRLQEGDWAEEGAKGRWFSACVPPKSRLQVLPSDTVQRLEVLVAPVSGSWAAINGGFYDQAAMGLVVSAGHTHTPLSAKGGSGVLSWGPGPAQIQHRDTYGGVAREALQSIDRLVDEGKVLVEARAGAHRDARSGIGLSPEGMCLTLAAADSSLVATPAGYQLIRTAGEGLTLAGFARLLRELQAVYALNLDGAVSSQMIVQTTEGRWEIRGERGTINGVVIHP